MNTNNNTAEQIMSAAPINPAQVLSVYSGKDGKCCCGCSGKHYYASATRDAASKERGYAVADDEVDDRMVARIVGLINTGGDAVEADLPSHVALVEDGRLYIAYLLEIETE